MSLHIHTQGQGPHLVFLHGWGLHGDVWEDIAAQLATDYTVSLVDLPGHGRSKLLNSDFSLQSLAKQLAQAFPKSAIWVGWSLGGLIALQIAHQYPKQVKALVMVASTPQFVRSDAWPHAVPAEVFEQFANELQADYKATLNRFIAIQAMGNRDAKAEVRKLRERLFRHGEPNVDALQGGLRILQQSQLQQELATLHCPTKIILGQRDSLAATRAGKTLAQQHDHVDVSVIQGAAHSPFVSHPEQFLATFKEFIEQHV